MLQKPSPPQGREAGTRSSRRPSARFPMDFTSISLSVLSRSRIARALLGDPPRMQQRVFGAANEAQGEIDVDRAHVATLDVEERCFACPQHPVHDAPHQRPRVPAPLYIRTCADGTDLAKVADPCPLAGHRDEPPAFANADVGSEL